MIANRAINYFSSSGPSSRSKPQQQQRSLEDVETRSDPSVTSDIAGVPDEHQSVSGFRDEPHNPSLESHIQQLPDMLAERYHLVHTDLHEALDTVLRMNANAIASESKSSAEAVEGPAHSVPEPDAPGHAFVDSQTATYIELFDESQSISNTPLLAKSASDEDAEGFNFFYDTASARSSSPQGRA